VGGGLKSVTTTAKKSGSSLLSPHYRNLTSPYSPPLPPTLSLLRQQQCVWLEKFPSQHPHEEMAGAGKGAELVGEGGEGEGEALLP
jgi:hypothetical protein